MIEVDIERVVPDKVSDAFVVLLRETGGQRLLPVWIRRPEAESIAAAVQKVKSKRPLTHDLCRSLIGALGGTLTAVHITRVQSDTYYAELLIKQSDGVVHIDSRPSDAMAIAVRTGAPIFVSESLLTMLDVPRDEEATDINDITFTPVAPAEFSAEQLKAYLEKLRPEDFGKFSP